MFGSNYNDYRMKLGYNPKSSTEADWVFYKKAIWIKEFAWLPHRCMLTKKIIWLKDAYKGTALYSVHNSVHDAVITSEYRWHDYDEHIIWELQK